MVRELGTRRALVPVPFFIWHTLAALMAILPNPPLTRDQVTLMRRDNIVGPTALTLKDLAVAPVSVEEMLPSYRASWQDGRRGP